MSNANLQPIAQVIDGKKVASVVRQKLKEQVESLLEQGRRKPGLAVILAGNNPASQIYVKNKIQACQKTGIESFLYEFDEKVSLDKIFQCIHQLNHSDEVDGMLIQLPLPGHLPANEVIKAVSPAKDADGLHPYNLGCLLSGEEGLRPCTPLGIMVLLEHYGIELAGRKVAVIGRSNLVGKPIALMLLEKNATITVCHSKTQDIEKITSQADLVIVAAGKSKLVRGFWIKPAAVVVDVGIHQHRLPSGESIITGDVDHQEVGMVASYLTPVPGGVGPMTVAMLLSNTLKAYLKNCPEEVKKSFA